MKNWRSFAGIGVVIVMAIACYQMAFVLKPGLISDQSTIEFRSQFILQHLQAWQLGWSCWILAALCLLGFFTLLLDFIPELTTKKLGYLLVGLGTLPDISAEILFAWVIPQSINLDPSLKSAQLLEWIAFYLTGFLGNGFYSIGGLLLTIALLQNTRINKHLVYAGLPAWIFGLGLSAACINQYFLLAGIFTGLAMVWSSIWFFVISIYIFGKENLRAE
jgi:hypothetical protein